ncbi:cobalt ABC transporter permease [Aliiroseovarius sp. F47248L]|uniref:cobalt ABC transporter permease n=1 Tax=Aliiroseovarius sp. F47248L TaxID=2926420 RepID=UPI001FF49E9E|nr:cobalt ABC transporter permease [Aliiroseovarius sp. F47248L]MCK0140552.1 cobalt ABC transporter permease [Aliiroseovarius sp. F47248L]
MIRILLLLVTVLAPMPALAHNVIAAVFPSGDAIEGEVGFSNGDMAADLVIEVFDDKRNKLGETRTDGDGFFLFTPSQPVTHIFRGDLGAGHVAEVVMPAAEVAGILGETAAAGSAGASVLAGATQSMTSQMPGLSDDTRAELAKMLRDELRPIRQELSAFKNKSNFQSVLGGIGYIFGLFGLGFYIAARRKLGGKT